MSHFLSRWWYQLTKAKQSSARPPEEEPYELRVQRAISFLTAISVLLPSRAGVSSLDLNPETGHYLDREYLQRHHLYPKPEYESMGVLISQTHALQICELMLVYGEAGLEVWLYRAGYLIPSARSVSSFIFKQAIHELDKQTQEPHIHFVHVSREEDLFQPFQVFSNKLGKTLLVHSQPRDGEIQVCKIAAAAAPEEVVPNLQPRDATTHTSNGILSVQYKVPRARFMRYPMPTNYDDYIEKYRGNADHAVMRDMLAELEHYRANVKGYEEIEALFWLAARDLVFFGTWDEEVHDWTGGFSMALNVNDTFYYASADAERIGLTDTIDLKKLYEKYGYPGLMAWASVKREEEVLPELRTDVFNQAHAEIMANAGCAKTDALFNRGDDESTGEPSE